MLATHLSFSWTRRHVKVKPCSQSCIATYKRLYKACNYQKAGSWSSCSMRGLQWITVAHLSVKEKEVHQERLGVRKVGLRDQLAPPSSSEANRSRWCRESKSARRLAGAGGLRLPDPGGPRTGKSPGPRPRSRETPRQQTAEGPPKQSHVGGLGAQWEVGTWLTPTRRLTAAQREAPGAREGPRRAWGSRTEALPASNDSRSPISAAAGYSRKAGRTWTAAASRGCWRWGSP